jgi:hypothetical protein
MKLPAVEVVVKLARTESGLGLHFDSNNEVTRLLTGCAAEANGGVRVGDVLLAVDNVKVRKGDHIGALFPMAVNEFELRLSRIPTSEDAEMKSMKPARPRRRGHAERVRHRREQSGKYEEGRMAPVFEEVVWNEYCVLFPDGSSAPFNEAVRYSALTGYLRKKEVVSDGRAEFAIAHGESQRGWVRHFVHLSMKQLAWFDEDPQEAIERQRATAVPRDWRVRMTSALRRFKHDHSRGKGVGSALFHTAPCRLYTSRLYRNEFALSFGSGHLLTLQAADGADAHTWVVALASCLFFSSEAFDAALAESTRFFDAANKTVGGKLSPIEALDLVRATGRRCTYQQVLRAAEHVGLEGGWFGAREFAYLMRSVCHEADPRAELIRCFELMDIEAVKATKAVKEPYATRHIDGAVSPQASSTSEPSEYCSVLSAGDGGAEGSSVAATSQYGTGSAGASQTSQTADSGFASPTSSSWGNAVPLPAVKSDALSSGVPTPPAASGGAAGRVSAPEQSSGAVVGRLEGGTGQPREATMPPAQPRGQVTVSWLTATMRSAGVPDDHIESVLRAVGSQPRADHAIDYRRLADSFYPAAATATMRRRACEAQAKLGQLSVKLHSASGLLAKDMNGKSDPYVIFKFGTEAEVRSSVATPQWEESIVISERTSAALTYSGNLSVTVMGKDAGMFDSTDDKIGECVVSLSVLDGKQSHEFMQPLSPEGTIHFTVSFSPMGGSDGEEEELQARVFSAGVFSALTAPSAAVAPHPAPVAANASAIPTLHISGRSSGEESQETNSQRMLDLKPQAPRGQLKASVLSPATLRTIANRIARARSANTTTASKQVPATREPRPFPPMSPQLGSPLYT